MPWVSPNSSIPFVNSTVSCDCFFAILTSFRSNIITVVMSQYRHQEIPMAYPAPPPSYPATEQFKEPSSGPYVAAPPPVGYPVRDGPQYPHQTFPPQTQSRGDGFWKGCCAALCCCWVLDCIF